MSPNGMIAFSGNFTMVRHETKRKEKEEKKRKKREKKKRKRRGKGGKKEKMKKKRRRREKRRRKKKCRSLAWVVTIDIADRTPTRSTQILIILVPGRIKSFDSPSHAGPITSGTTRSAPALCLENTALFRLPYTESETGPSSECLYRLYR